MPIASRIGMELEPPPSYDSVYGSINDAGCHLSGKTPEMKMDTPAAPVLSSEQQQNNVILNQPTTAETRQDTVQAPPSDYLVCTIVMVFLVGYHLPAMVCLIPAICFAAIASNYKKAGDFSRASSYGDAALCFNILAIVYFIVIVIITAIAVPVALTTSTHLSVGGGAGGFG